MTALWTGLCALMFLVFAGAQAEAASQPKPVIVLDARAVTPLNEERRLPTTAGEITWSPDAPVIKGDRLQATFSMTEGVPIRDVRVKLDGKPYAYLKNPPWRVIVDTSTLAPGRHVLVGEVRSRSSVIMYGFATLEFEVQDQPSTLVLGTVEEIIDGARASQEPPRVDSTISVTLRSLDPQTDRAIRSGAALPVNRPITFYVDTDLNRWAYSVTRGGIEVLSGGPMSRQVYLELAPKIGNQPGLLPGDLMLSAWGVRDDGTRSAPATIPIVVSQAGE